MYNDLIFGLHMLKALLIFLKPVKLILSHFFAKVKTSTKCCFVVSQRLSSRRNLCELAPNGKFDFYRPDLDGIS